jgi:hypothetical protein
MVLALYLLAHDLGDGRVYRKHARQSDRFGTPLEILNFVHS